MVKSFAFIGDVKKFIPRRRQSYENIFIFVNTNSKRPAGKAEHRAATCNNSNPKQINKALWRATNIA
jgi:hypothetical protein